MRVYYVLRGSTTVGLTETGITPGPSVSVRPDPLFCLAGVRAGRGSERDRMNDKRRETQTPSHSRALDESVSGAPDLGGEGGCGVSGDRVS